MLDILNNSYKKNDEDCVILVDRLVQTEEFFGYENSMDKRYIWIATVVEYEGIWHFYVNHGCITWNLVH